MELVGEAAGVRWFNDSKATTVFPLHRRWRRFRRMPDQRLHWIAARPRATGWRRAARGSGMFAKPIWIGAAMEGFATEIGDALPIDRSGDMATAVAHAAAAQSPATSSWLSPACASFDQFKDYEQRGDVFRGLVQALGA